MKYLIVSEYQYYDNYDFSNVCICDTRERAEQLVKEFNANKEQFKLIKGYRLHLDGDNEEQLKHFSGFDKINLTESNSYVLFINEDNFKIYKEHLVKGYYHFEKTTYFNFMCYMSWRSDITSKYCNHQDAKLVIHPIQEM